MVGCWAGEGNDFWIVSPDATATARAAAKDVSNMSSPPSRSGALLSDENPAHVSVNVIHGVSTNGAIQLPINSAACGPLKRPWNDEGPATPGGRLNDPENVVLPFAYTVFSNV